MIPIKTPATAGPRNVAPLVAPSTSVFARATTASSRPTTAGITSRCAAKYGVENTPIALTRTSNSANDRCPAACRMGMRATNGARAASHTSIVVRAPNRSITDPLGMPRIASGRSSTAKTIPIRVGDPVVDKTNQGIASADNCDPKADRPSAVTSERSCRRWFTEARRATETRRTKQRQGPHPESGHPVRASSA